MSNISYPKTDNVKLAICAIIFAVFSLSVGDALIKNLGVSFSLWQIFILRSIFTLPVLLIVIRLFYTGVPFIPRHFGWTALRSLMLTIMWLVYYLALVSIDLSVAAAAFYTLPIFISLFAALFIGEKVGASGWVATALGFTGVLLILKPQASDFNIYAILPLISAILYALSMILTRTKCQNEHPMVLSLGLNIAFLVVGLFAIGLFNIHPPSQELVTSQSFLFGPFSDMGNSEWIAISLMSLAIIFGSVGAAIAYQIAPASVVATFDFSYLAFAALWGVIFFAERPDLITLLGMSLITIAGIIAIKRR